MAERVLVTGIDGFIGKHVALRLLRDGYAVRGTVMDLDRAETVRRALSAHGADLARLEFEQADLTRDDGWADLVSDCVYVVHIASPFPVLLPKDREALVPVARDGALRVVEAALAADVRRVVVTSSLVAMMYRPDRPAEAIIGEHDWTDPEWTLLNAYMVSKTRAERAVWQHAEARGAADRVVTIAPALVLGPALDDEIGTSLGIVKMIVTGENPAHPPTSHPVVDVRDVADLHVAAMTAPDVGGRRLIASADTLSVPQMADILREALPEHADTIKARVLPDFMVKLLALMVPGLRSLLPDLGVVARADAVYVTELTGVRFRPAREAVAAAGRAIADNL